MTEQRDESDMTWDTFRVEFDDDGTLRQRGRIGWREAKCAECGEPIRWVLDMGSYKHMDDGSFALCHAYCVWLPEAFDKDRAIALEKHGDSA